MLFAPYAPVPDRPQPSRRANRFALLLFGLAATVGLLVKYLA